MFQGIKQSIVASSAVHKVKKAMGTENPYENQPKKPSNRQLKALKKKQNRKAGYMGNSPTKRYASPKLRKKVRDRQVNLVM